MTGARVMASEDRLQAYLILGEDICERTGQLVDEVNPLLVANPDILSYRYRVLIGFALKIDSSFRRLIVDARARRLEAMHQLKTVVEAFIYFHAITRDLTDETAALVVAHAGSHRGSETPGHRLSLCPSMRECAMSYSAKSLKVGEGFQG